MSNHTQLLDHVTLIPWIFLEIFTSGRYHKDMKILKILAPNSKHFRIYNIFLVASADILNPTFSLITSVSNNVWKFTGVYFLTQEIQNGIEIALNLLVLSYRKILSKFNIHYISVKEKDLALLLSNFLSLDHTVSNIIKLM